MYVLTTGLKDLDLTPIDQYLAVVYVEVTLVSTPVVRLCQLYVIALMLPFVVVYFCIKGDICVVILD